MAMDLPERAVKASSYGRLKIRSSVLSLLSSQRRMECTI